MFIRMTSVSSIMRDIEKKIEQLKAHQDKQIAHSIELEEQVQFLKQKQAKAEQEAADAQRVRLNLSKILIGEV